jgi:hypothetical protein
MARFNQTVQRGSVKTYSYEGGDVYVESPIDSWFNMLFSSFAEDTFYEKANTQLARFIDQTEIVAQTYGYEFVAKCAVFARNELGLRSISQLTAAWLNDKPMNRKREFYRVFCHRADDPSELFAAVDVLGQKRSHALVRGCGDYVSTLSEYQLAKYLLENRKYKMADIINLTHPVYSPAVRKFKMDELEAPETWENRIMTAPDKESRDAAWKSLVENHSLGYMALIRNLNNIMSIDDIDLTWIDTYLCPQITDSDAIRRSLIFPYRIYTAFRMLRYKNLHVVKALDDAFMLAVDNVPTFSGRSAIILDVSGSMEESISSHSVVTIKQAGAVFAAILMLKNPDTIFIKFGTKAKKLDKTRILSAFGLISELETNDDCDYSTRVSPAFEMLKNEAIDRVFLISDMQVMDGGYYNQSAYIVYRKNCGETLLYSFDLGNYPTQVTPLVPWVHYVTTLGNNVYDFIRLCEEDKSLVDYINDKYSYLFS